MMNMNNVQELGRLARDPEILLTKGGTKIARFTIAVDRGGKNGGVDWIPATAFGKTAEYLENYLRKGALVLAIGRLQTSNYTDKEGNKRFDMRLIANSVQSMKANGNGDAVPAAPAVETTPADMVVADDDLPF